MMVLDKNKKFWPLKEIDIQACKILSEVFKVACMDIYM